MTVERETEKGPGETRFEIILKDVLEKREDHSFPLALFAKDLREQYDLKTKEEQIEFATYAVKRPENKAGRMMILHREDFNDPKSPATQVARGRGGELPASYVTPHVEVESCDFESFAVSKGKVVLVIWDEETHEPKEFIQLSEVPYKINRFTIHSLLYYRDENEDSDIVIAEEVKVMKPGSPKVGVEWAIKEGDPRVPEELERLYALADEALNK